MTSPNLSVEQQLRDERERLRAVLTAVEWKGVSRLRNGLFVDACPSCAGFSLLMPDSYLSRGETKGHGPDCELDSVLNKEAKT